MIALDVVQDVANAVIADLLGNPLEALDHGLGLGFVEHDVCALRRSGERRVQHGVAGHDQRAALIVKTIGIGRFHRRMVNLDSGDFQGTVIQHNGLSVEGRACRAL